VAIQGEAGSFSHVAALALCGDLLALVPCRTFEALFHAVASRRSERGVIPVENSLTGPVGRNAELIGAHGLEVVGQIRLRVRLCLIVRPGTAFAAVRRVASHPVALAQCRRFFARHGRLVAVPGYDTAGAVRDLMTGCRAADAAIGPSFAATLYGAHVLEDGLEDDGTSYTRFLAVTRRAAS
jgi:prephenate dehydratase